MTNSVVGSAAAAVSDEAESPAALSEPAKRRAIGSFFMLHDTKAAIEALILGFLLSPYGIPMIGAAIIAFIQGINEAIKSI